MSPHFHLEYNGIISAIFQISKRTNSGIGTNEFLTGTENNFTQEDKKLFKTSELEIVPKLT